MATNLLKIHVFIGSTVVTMAALIELIIKLCIYYGRDLPCFALIHSYFNPTFNLVGPNEQLVLLK